MYLEDKYDILEAQLYPDPLSSVNIAFDNFLDGSFWCNIIIKIL
jgi:hypothetical protein